MKITLIRPIFIVATIVLLCIASSCSLYKVIPESPYTAQSIKQYEEEGKFLILHREEHAWHIYDLRIVNDSIHAKLDPQLGYHVDYLNPKGKGLHEFSRKLEPDVINSVHIYTSDSSFGYWDDVVSIHLESIYEVNLYTYARAASRASVIVPSVLFIPVSLLFLFTLYAISGDYY